MYINAQISSRGDRSLIKLDVVGGMMLNRRSHNITAGGVVLTVTADETTLNTRYDDICAALESGDVTIYDCNKDVGYWKPATPKRAPAKKAPPKKEAP